MVTFEQVLICMKESWRSILNGACSALMQLIEMAQVTFWVMMDVLGDIRMLVMPEWDVGCLMHM